MSLLSLPQDAVFTQQINDSKASLVSEGWRESLGALLLSLLSIDLSDNIFDRVCCI